MTQVTVERNYGEKVKLIRKLAICPCHEQRIGVEQSIYIYIDTKKLECYSYEQKQLTNTIMHVMRKWRKWPCVGEVIR